MIADESASAILGEPVDPNTTEAAIRLREAAQRFGALGAPIDDRDSRAWAANRSLLKAAIVYANEVRRREPVGRQEDGLAMIAREREPLGDLGTVAWKWIGPGIIPTDTSDANLRLLGALCAAELDRRMQARKEGT